MRGTRKNKLGKIEKNKNVLEGDCIFPFKKKSIVYNDCMETEKGMICATEINPKSKTLKKYGYCEVLKSKSTSKSKSSTSKGSTSKGSTSKAAAEDTPRVILHIHQYKKEGPSYLDTLNESEIETMIDYANQLYYGNEEIIMSDDEYDILRDYTLKRFPDNKMAQEGQHELLLAQNVLFKTTLPYQMWSMDKKKPEDIKSIEKWKTTYTAPYILSCKLDGISGLFTNEGGIPKLYSRGNGVIGQDLSHLIPHIKLPHGIKDIVIRGEFIISKNNFKKIKEPFSNARNFVGGLVNTKKPKPEHLKYLEFIGYEVIQPVLKPSEQLLFIHKHGWPCVVYRIEQDIPLKILQETLSEWRAKSEYDMDGIICTSDMIIKRTKGNPKHAFAFKMALDDQMSQSKVIDVIWSASKDGYLKPRIQIEEIELAGVKINFATGFNAKFIVENKIGKGALVQIIRSGDVIPHIYKVLQQAETPIMPEEDYIWNETKVDIMLTTSNIEVREKIMIAFFKKIGVLGLGPGNIKKIMKQGFDTIEKVLSMSLADFQSVPGFKEKLSDKIYNSIQEQIKETTLGLLMEASNLFGRGFGYKKIDTILKAHPDILTSDISRDEKISILTKINGMSTKTAKLFIDKIPEFMIWLTNANLIHKLSNVRIVSSKSSGKLLSRENIVMTGFRDKELSLFIESSGGTIQNTISKSTTLLIVKNADDETTKTKKAIQNDIPIIELVSFKKKYNL